MTEERLDNQMSPVEHGKKRSDYLEWSEYFMAVSFLSAMRSKDPATQVGACIVSPDNRIVGIGYNGMPRGCSDDKLPWGKHSDNELDNKADIHFIQFDKSMDYSKRGERSSECRLQLRSFFLCNTVTSPKPL